MKLVIEDGTLIGPRDRTFGRLVAIEIELLDRPYALTPTEVRQRVGCPFCDAEKGAMCRRWRGGDRKSNHAERVQFALASVDGDGTVSERSERYGDLAVVEGRKRLEKEPSLKRSQERPTATQLERDAVGRIWDHYLELVQSRRKLDAKRSRIVRNALAIVRSAYGCDLGEAERLVKQAVLGLSRSPFHNGQNEQHKKYLEIRYALKGIGDESDDERIEKAIAWAQIYTPAGTIADGRPESVDEAKLQRWLEDIRYTLSLPHRPERERAVESLKRLRAHGFDVQHFDRPPWARLVRK